MVTLAQIRAGLDAEQQRAFDRLTDEQREDILRSANGMGEVDVKAPVDPATGTVTNLATLYGAKKALDYGMSIGAGTAGGAPATPVVVGGGLEGSAAAAGFKPVATSGWELGNIGAAGNYIAPTAGLVGLYDLYKNDRKDIGTGKGYLQGAASGAAIGSYFGPVGAVVGGGVGLLANAFGIGGKSRTKGEEDARKRIEKAGIDIPNEGVKEWELNEKFRESRNESDLVGKDIIHAADFYNIQGYDKLDAAKQELIAQEALKRGLIRERLGKIELSSNPEFDAYLKSQLASPAPSSGGGDSREIVAEEKKRRKKAALADFLPRIEAEVTRAPDYSVNISNPYL